MRGNWRPLLSWPPMGGGNRRSRKPIGVKAGRLRCFGLTLQAKRLCLIALHQFRRSRRRASFDAALNLQSASHRLIVLRVIKTSFNAALDLETARHRLIVLRVIYTSLVPAIDLPAAGDGLVMVVTGPRGELVIQASFDAALDL